MCIDDDFDKLDDGGYVKKSDVDKVARWGFWVTVTLWLVLVLFVLFY